MVKIVTLFLVVIAAIALAGRFVRTRRGDRQPPRTGSAGTFRKCGHCGKYRLVGTTCDCGAKR